MPRRRRSLAVQLAVLVAALCTTLPAVLTGASTASAATATSTSANWAGYVARRTGVAFRHVSGTWTVPTVDCSTDANGASANWVGLGGASSTSPALEQLGTESDCRAGTPRYSAWFEIVPAASTTSPLTIRPGDVVSASVAVRRHVVTLRMTDVTRGRTATRVVRAPTVDRSSAEWILEAPSLCAGATATAATCRQTALANFGTTAFSAARATTLGGHTGAIADPHWTAVAITLAQGAGGQGPQMLPSGGAGARGELRSAITAVPGPLSPQGTAFSVAFTDETAIPTGADPVS